MIFDKKCLLICDDPLDQALFAQALSDVSPDTICLVASNASDALYMMTHENVIPSYIFVELDMPKMNGLEFLREVKTNEELKEIPVVVHSMSPQPHKVIALKEAGAHALYFRPYEYSSVCNMLTLYFTSEMASILPN